MKKFKVIGMKSDCNVRPVKMRWGEFKWALDRWMDGVRDPDSGTAWRAMLTVEQNTMVRWLDLMYERMQREQTNVLMAEAQELFAEPESIPYDADLPSWWEKI